MACRKRYQRLLASVSFLTLFGLGCGTSNGGRADLDLQVLDARSNQGVAEALVIVPGQIPRRTGATGHVRLNLKADTYTRGIQHKDYQAASLNVSLVPGVAIAKTINLNPRPERSTSPAPSPDPQTSPTPRASTSPTAMLRGRVSDETGSRLANVTLYVETPMGLAVAMANSNKVGEYRIEGLPLQTPLKVSAILEGYQTVSRALNLKGNWQMDFSGVYALRKNNGATPGVGAPMLVKVSGRVEDTMGRALPRAIVRIESEGPQDSFKEAVLSKQGGFETRVPVDMPLRFTASKPNHRTISFVETIRRPEAGENPRLDFTGIRALDHLPILEKE